MLLLLRQVVRFFIHLSIHPRYFLFLLREIVLFFFHLCVRPRYTTACFAHVRHRIPIVSHSWAGLAAGLGTAAMAKKHCWNVVSVRVCHNAFHKNVDFLVVFKGVALNGAILIFAARDWPLLLREMVLEGTAAVGLQNRLQQCLDADGGHFEAWLFTDVAFLVRVRK